MSNSEESNGSTMQTKYMGVRRRKWGKWVSEIRVPGTQDRLWLGSYKTPEAAAVAHDIAYYCLRGPSCIDKLNFPLLLPASVEVGISPRSIQKAASDGGMAIDAQLIEKSSNLEREYRGDLESNGGGLWRSEDLYQGESLDISVEDYL